MQIVQNESLSYCCDDSFDRIKLEHELKIKQNNLKINYIEEEMIKILKQEEELINTKREIFNALDFGEIHRKKLHEYIHTIKGNIRVYCRVKPRVNINEETIVKYPELCLGNYLTNINCTPELYTVELKNSKTQENLIFNFDRIFAENCSQDEVIIIKIIY